MTAIAICAVVAVLAVAWAVPEEETHNVTDDIRLMRAKSAAQTHCKRGHEFTDENTWTCSKSGKRRCRTCDRDRARAYKAALRAARKASANTTQEDQ